MTRQIVLEAPFSRTARPLQFSFSTQPWAQESGFNVLNPYHHHHLKSVRCYTYVKKIILIYFGLFCEFHALQGERNHPISGDTQISKQFLNPWGWKQIKKSNLWGWWKDILYHLKNLKCQDRNGYLCPSCPPSEKNNNIETSIWFRRKCAILLGHKLELPWIFFCEKHYIFWLIEYEAFIFNDTCLTKNQ